MVKYPSNQADAIYRDAIEMFGGMFYDYAVIPTVIFVVQKYLGAINWDWKWVLSPLWIAPAFLGLLFLLGMSFGLLHRKRRNA